MNKCLVQKTPGKGRQEEVWESMAESVSYKCKFHIYGEEIIDRVVGRHGNSGGIYLPAAWRGCHVKIIKLD